MIRRALIAALLLLAPSAAGAQDLSALAAKAKGQSFTAAIAGEQAYIESVTEFGRKFDVKIDTAVMRPSTAMQRIQTEQKNGQYGWDIWMGGTSNMSNNASPMGLLEPMDQYLITPDVKDPKNWLNANFMFGDEGRRVFTFVHRLEFYVLRNTSVLPDVKIESWDDLLDPRLKGKISVRDSSVPNGGSFMLATLYGAKGPEVLRKFLSQQDVHIYENPQQLAQALFRGGQAIGLGLEAYLWDKCRSEGGCQDVVQTRKFATAISLGFSVPKNPPHPDAVRLWTNWFLSKEGQEFWVKAWVKENSTGGVSLRRDVPPLPGHEIYQPDYEQPEQYVFVATDKGAKEIEGAIKVYKEVEEK